MSERTYLRRPLRELFEQRITPLWTIIGKGPSVDPWYFAAGNSWQWPIRGRLGINEVARYIGCDFALWIDSKITLPSFVTDAVQVIRPQGNAADWCWNGADDLPASLMGKTAATAVLVVGEWAKRQKQRVRITLVGFDSVDQPVWTRETLYAKLFDDIKESRTIDLTMHVKQLMAAVDAYSDWLDVTWWHRDDLRELQETTKCHYHSGRLQP